MKKTAGKIIGAAMAMTALSPCMGDVVYRNDFSSRTSSEAIPRASWLVKRCAYPAPLMYTYTVSRESDYTSLLPYGSLTRIQDGWTKVLGNNLGYQLVNFWARVNASATNPFACFSNQSGQYGVSHEVMAVQPLHNAFSNGTLRVSADFYVPDVAPDQLSGGYLRIKPLFRQHLSPGVASYSPYALAFGPANGGSILQLAGSDGNWASPVAYGTQVKGNLKRTHWYRLVVDMNLDDSTVSSWAYDLGTDQPTPETEPAGDPVGSTTGTWLYRRTAEYGPICALGLDMKNMTAYTQTSETDTTLAIAKAPGVDNLRVWWKPTEKTGAFSDDDLFYENDFAMRRYRHLQGTTASDASAYALTETDCDVYRFWDACKSGEAPAVTNLVSPAADPGRDGWKGTAWSDGKATPVIISTSAGGNVLAMLTRGSFAKITHAIGQAISSGKMLFECDIRLPDKWYQNDSQTFTLCLGTDTLAKEQNSGYAIRVGVAGANGGDRTKFYPYAYIDTATGSRSDTSCSLKASTWYRMRVVADLSAKAYDYELYELGTEAGNFDRTCPDTPTYRRQGCGFFSVTAPKAFTTLAIYAYQAGADWKGCEVVDNIRVAKGSDGTNWTDVYRNDFNERIRYGVRSASEATLLNADVNRTGLDGWMRRDVCDGDWFVRQVSGGDPCLAFDGEGQLAHAMHLLGKPVKRGELTMRVDMRPPERVTKSSKQVARVWVGGDEFAQGEVGTYAATHGTLRNFTDAAVGYFGFARDGACDDVGYYKSLKFSVCDANGAQSAGDVAEGSHWYRFVAKFNVTEKAWRVDVFDQGTAQPGENDANGSLVQSFENLSFAFADPTGISAFDLVAAASAGSQPLEADSKGLLVDNIVVEKDRQGMTLIFR